MLTQCEWWESNPHARRRLLLMQLCIPVPPHSQTVLVYSIYIRTITNWKIMPYKDYNDEKILVAVKESKSFAGFLRYLGKKQAGGSYSHFKKILQRLNPDCSHWTGQAWCRDEQLKDWKDYTRSSQIRKHLFKLNNYTCQKCNNNTWCNQPIPLEIHHIDGDKTNNELSNLQCLCPNCHSQTPNFRSKNKLT